VDDVTDASDQEELKKSILETIGKEVALQKHRLELTRELDDIAFASDIQEPDAPTRETLLRYRAANTREFKDLVGALELIRLFGSGIRGNSMDLLRLPTMANLMMKTESQDSAVHRGSSGSESIPPFATFIKNEPGERPSNANSRTRS
jgi:hypothetical protein